MTYTPPVRTYGLRVTTAQEKYIDHPTTIARVLVRENQEDSPINPRSEGESSIYGAPPNMQGLALADLELRIFFYTSESGRTSTACGPEIEYRNVHSVDIRQATRMAKTLTRIHKAIEKANAREAGDVLMAFAKALGLTFTVTEQAATYRGTTPSWQKYSDSDWRFSKLTDARDQLRAQIEKTRAELTAVAA